MWPGWSWGHKTFFHVQLNWVWNFIMFMNVKMQTIVGILTFISMINTCTTSESLKARKVLTIHQLSFYKQLKFHAQLSWAWKSFINLKARTKYILLCNWQQLGHYQPTFKWLSTYENLWAPLCASQLLCSCTMQPGRSRNEDFWGISPADLKPCIAAVAGDE